MAQDPPRRSTGGAQGAIGWPTVGRRLAAIALVWCVLLLLAHIAGAHLACGFDTSNCSPTRQKNTVFRGQLPVANAPFAMRFGSVTATGGGPVGGFRTDQHGNYCIVWSGEGGSFVIDNQESYGSTQIGTPLVGRPPRGCQTGDRGIPWNVAKDLRTSWQYITVFALALLAIVVLAAGMLGARIDRGQRLRVVGLALTAATTTLLLAVWWTQI